MTAPKFPSLFRSAENQRFDYKARYYDEEKEKREKRAKMMGDESGDLARKPIKFKSSGSGAMRSSNARLVFLVVVLTALAAYVITY